MEFNFLGKYILSGEILCKTGLHIGGTTEGFEIGGVDNSIIRDPMTDWPYIPGSSLKGRLRHWLEWRLGSIQYHEKHKIYGAHYCGECDACILFGPASEETPVRLKSGPTRVTIRDAFPTDTTLEKWKLWLGENVYSEIKSENTLDRVTSEANPRPMERVPAGSAFTFEMVIDVYSKDESTRLMRSLFSAIRLLENSSLGGNGSRGYGQVEFQQLTLTARPVLYYQEGKGEERISLPANTIEQLIKQFDQIKWSF